MVEISCKFTYSDPVGKKLTRDTCEITVISNPTIVIKINIMDHSIQNKLVGGNFRGLVWTERKIDFWKFYGNSLGKCIDVRGN